jgi:hypothetical protein
LSPDVAADVAGNFMVVWSTAFSGAFAQLYDSGGSGIGSEVQLSSGFLPAVAADGMGNFIAVWQADDGSDSGVFGRRYAGTGVPLGPEFRVNTETRRSQGQPTIAADAGEDFVVAWVSLQQDGSGLGIFGQRFEPATPSLIHGKRLLLRDPTGVESTRQVVVLGRETATDIGPTIIGNPVTGGAILRLIANGGTDSDQTYVLDPQGWTALGTGGFRYTGPTGADGDPVRKLVLKRTPSDRALLSVLLHGKVGTQDLDVVPPNPGDDGGLILTINGGGATYCVAFGGAAGGAEQSDTAGFWRVSDATAEPGCPSP